MKLSKPIFSAILLAFAILLAAAIPYRASGNPAAAGDIAPSPPTRPALPQMVLQNGHTAPVMGTAFCPNQGLLATGGIDGTIKLWDVESGKLLETLAGHTDILCLTFSPDGRLLAAGCGNSSLKLWDTGSGKLLMTLEGHQKPVWSVSFSPDGRTLASGSLDSTIRLWDPSTGELSGSLKGHTDSVRAVSFSPDGLKLASGGNDGTLRIWDLATQKQETALDLGGAIWSVAYSQDGKHLATAGENLPVEIRAAQTGKPLLALSYAPDTVYSLAFSPDGRMLATGGSDHSARLWEVASGKNLAVLEGHTYPVFSVAFSPNGQLLATGSDDTTARIWELPQGKLLATLQGHSAWILSLAWGPGQPLLATGSMDGFARIWDLETGELRPYAMNQASWVRAVALGPQAILASGGDSADIKLWDAAGGKLLSTIQAPADSFWSLAFSPDGKILAGGAQDGLVYLWKAASGELLLKLAGHRGAVRSITFSRDGSLLATGSEDSSARLWETATGKLIQTCQASSPVLTVALSPDNRTLALGCDDSKAALWNLDLGKQTALLSGHSGWVFSSAFSPDGRTLATGSLDSTVRIWEVPSGRPGAVIKGHTDGVMSVAFSPDGRVVASAGMDSTLKFWNPSTGQSLATALQFSPGEDWLVVSPEGFFDGSPAGMQKILWRLGESIHDTAEPEQYFNEFYQPGLLAEVVKSARTIPEILKERGDARADLTITQKDRRLPGVSIKAPAHSSKRTIPVKVLLTEAPADFAHPGPAGIQDVRLFRNGTLVTRWSGPRPPGILTATIPLVAGKNVLTAYAFNHDNVKSKDASALVAGAPSLKRDSQAYVLCIGINHYANPRFSLSYAGADATATARALKANLPFAAGALHVRTLLDEAATRAGILAALKSLADRAQPEDTVIVTYSGHGINYQGHFYLIPQDQGPARTEAQLARQGISDSDLESVFLAMQSQHIALVLDACHSGQALESDEWRRGPMNSRGLVQLAWEKGMDVLVASQSQQAALEAWQVGGKRIGHGLLTYALINEGFTQAPRRDGALLARNWLDYAAARVPQLLGEQEVMQRAILLGGPKAGALQIPRVFHRREGGSDWAVAGRR